MSKTGIAALDDGLRRIGTAARAAQVRGVTGEDELALAELPSEAGVAVRVTELLARTVGVAGDRTSAGRDAVRALSVGERERLLLELHAASFGAATEVTVACPCGEQLELTIDLADLIEDVSDTPTPESLVRFGDEVIRIRVPTGADQEAAAGLAGSDPEAAAEALLARCLVETPCGDAAALRPLVAERLQALDPQAESIVQAACPSCGTDTAVLVDAAALVLGRMAGGRRLLAQVDRIARTYHWSEAEILALPTGRRRAYLDLIDTAEAAS